MYPKTSSLPPFLFFFYGRRLRLTYNDTCSKLLCFQLCESRNGSTKQGASKNVTSTWTYWTYLEKDDKDNWRRFEEEKAAGWILSQIWSEIVLDVHPVLSYCMEQATVINDGYEEWWVVKQCGILQYTLQYFVYNNNVTLSFMFWFFHMFMLSFILKELNFITKIENLITSS